MILPLLTAAFTYIGATTKPYPVVNTDIVVTTWESQGEGLEYELQCAPIEDFTTIYPRHTPTLKLRQACQFLRDVMNCRRLYFGEPNTVKTEYIDLGCYYVDLPEEELVVDIPEAEIVIEEMVKEEDILVEDFELLDNREVVIEIEEDDIEEEFVIDLNSEVLGERDNSFCNFNFLKRDSIKYLDNDCDLEIKVKESSYKGDNGLYVLESEGSYKRSIKANVNVYTCKDFSLFDIKTWFRCERVLESTDVDDIDLDYIAYFSVNSQRRYPDGFIFKDDAFYIRRIFEKDVGKKRLGVRVKYYGSIDLDGIVDFEKVIEIPIDLNNESGIENDNRDSKPFSYPLQKLIGVTQWHGCTEYQCPHDGIDFGASLDNITAISDGDVVKTGYDKYGGECFQGGWYVKVKQDNGMYSLYMHLDSFTVKSGDRVREGEVIGISGNSGRYNCQNLKHHLHFEIRKNANGESHVNPVDYIDVDWNSIPTLGWRSNPGRLSGDNPHPNF